MEGRETLYGKTLQELKACALECGLQSFAGRQLADWLYRKHVSSIGEMTNLSKAGREALEERFVIGRVPPVECHQSVDGTRKYLFAAGAGKFVESAWIPDHETERATLCVSSQVGCKMGCLFCMTGRQGFQGQLTAGEILNQVGSLPERESLKNIVYMGMGEPLDNYQAVLNSLQVLTSDWGYGWSPTRITVSTIGILPGLRNFLRESRCHLALSLHSPFESERKRLMPIQSVYPLQEVIDELRVHDWKGQRRIFVEYIMFRGVNDSLRHVKELARLLAGLPCRINLIRFHPIPATPLEASDEVTIREFQQALTDKGFITTRRASRGQDISAACGLLSTKARVHQEQGGDY